MGHRLLEGVEIHKTLASAQSNILTQSALSFLAQLHRQFNSRRLELLEKRVRRQKLLDDGVKPDYLQETKSIRENASWRVAPAPRDLMKRRVEITGPTERKMLINALNSGADVFMADFEDSLSPTWDNIIDGQVNLRDTIDRTITYTNPEGKIYALNDKIAVLVVRPRGWHLPEKHLTVDGEPISGSLFDFGLYFFHNAKKLLSQGSGPYFYLPKMESHLEARLWNDVFIFAQKELGIPQGTIRATVLIETILAAFEMEEILYELKEHSAGLNAGRWDYIFSILKKFSANKDFLFPDRGEITMTTPFMRAYTELLVKTCHRRGAFALGGMAAYIPSRKDKKINDIALAKVREDKLRESRDGFDGTWVAHPDLVPIAKEVFEKSLGSKPNQLDKQRPEVHVDSNDLLNFTVPGGKITEAGLRQNIDVALQYLDSWLRGTGAVAIYNLMEDSATAEISRAQLWQWVHHGAKLDSGLPITPELYKKVAKEEYEKLGKSDKLNQAYTLLNELVLSEEFKEFLTLQGYNLLD